MSMIYGLEKSGKIAVIKVKRPLVDETGCDRAWIDLNLFGLGKLSETY